MTGPDGSPQSSSGDPGAGGDAAVVRALTTHTGLIEVLTRARTLGFTGPGEPVDHITHAVRFVDVVCAVTDARASRSGQTDTGGASGPALDAVIHGYDLGSGAGLPGLVLAVALPASRWTLVESMQRRATVLTEAVGELGVADRVDVVMERAEVLGRNAHNRETADVVVARSFAAPAVTAECAAPLLMEGGHLLVSEPPQSSGERWPSGPLAELGLQPVGTDRGLMVVTKVAPTPDRYPRRVGIPAKRPLF